MIGIIFSKAIRPLELIMPRISQYVKIFMDVKMDGCNECKDIKMDLKIKTINQCFSVWMIRRYYKNIKLFEPRLKTSKILN